MESGSPAAQAVDLVDQATGDARVVWSSVMTRAGSVIGKVERGSPATQAVDLVGQAAGGVRPPQIPQRQPFQACAAGGPRSKPAQQAFRPTPDVDLST